MHVLMRRMTAFAACVCLLALEGFPTPLDCASSAPNVTIDAAGSYVVTCTVTPGSSWFLHIVGCNSSSGSSTGVVSITLLSSPTQVLVSDNTSQVGPQSASLTSCSVSITYAANTTVPDGTDRLQAHVLVATASPLQGLSVTLLATLYIQGAFVAVAGNGSGTIGHVLVAAPPSSSIVCYSEADESCGKPADGTSLLRLDPGCPVILKVSIALNGTNTSAAMRGYPGPTFVLINLNNLTLSSITKVPLLHDIALENMDGIVFRSPLLMTVMGLLGITVATAYPEFNGTISVRRCSATYYQGNFPMFDFAVSFVFSILFEYVQATSVLVQVAPWPTLTKSMIRLHHCTIKLTTQQQLVNIFSTDASWFALGIDSYNTSFTADGDAALVGVVPTPFNDVERTLDLSFRSCVFHLTNTGPRILDVVGPTLVRSTIKFNRVAFNLQWTPDVATAFNFTAGVPYDIVYPPRSLLELMDFVNSTIVLLQCNMTTQQAAAPPVRTPLPGLLLAISGAITGSFIFVSQSTFTVVLNSSFVPVQAPLLFINTSSASTLVIKRTALTNINTTLMTQTAAVAQVNSTSVVVDCGTLWCKRRPEANSVTTCSRPLTLMALLGTTNFGAMTISLCTSRSYSEPVSLTQRTTLSHSSSITSMPLASALSQLTTPSSTFRNNLSTLSPTTLLSRSATLPIAPPPMFAPEPPVVVQAAAVAVVAPLAAAVIATSVAGVIQRSTVAIRFSACGNAAPRDSGPAPPPNPRGEHMAVAENPTRLSFGPPEGAMYRGSAVGNLILFVAAALLSAIGAVAYRQLKARNCAAPDRSPDAACSSTLGAALATLQLPGRAYIVYAVLLQPTVTAAVGLLMAGPASPGDGVLAVLTLLVLVAVGAWPAWAVHRGCATLVTAEHIPPTGGVLDYIIGRRVVWVPRGAPSDEFEHYSVRGLPPTQNPSAAPTTEGVLDAAHFAQQFSTFIGRVRAGTWRELFFVLGFTWSFATGVVGALDPADPPSCRAAQVTLVVVAGLSLASIVTVRPYASPADRNVNLVLEALSLVVAVLSLTGAGGTEGVSYAQIGMSAGVTALRLVTRARELLHKRWKTPPKAPKGIESGDADNVPMLVSPSVPLHSIAVDHLLPTTAEEIIEDQGRERIRSIYNNSAIPPIFINPATSITKDNSGLIEADGARMLRSALSWCHELPPGDSCTDGRSFLSPYTLRQHLANLVKLAAGSQEYGSLKTLTVPQENSVCE